MSLKEKLNAQQVESRQRMGVETWALIDQVTEGLRQSGMIDRCLKAGDRMPAFSLPNATGQTVNSSDLLANGPLVVSFYRGGW